MLAHDLASLVTFQQLRAGIPGRDVAPGVEKEDGVIFDGLDEGAESLVDGQPAEGPFVVAAGRGRLGPFPFDDQPQELLLIEDRDDARRPDDAGRRRVGSVA